jgi:hypothetical protein
VQAAAGLCVIALGDERTGSRLLLDLVEGNAASHLPLATGLVGAEMARLELEHGDRHAATRWIDRTNRFARRYNSQLPMQVIGRMRAHLPAGQG